MELTLIALGYAAGLDPRRAGLLAATAAAPLFVVVVLIVLFLRQRSTRPDVATLFCEGVAAELRSGSTLNHAIQASAEAVDLPLDRNGVLPVPVLPESAGGLGGDVELVVAASARAGSHVADVFDELASISLAQAELRRELAIAAAPTRVTAALFVAAPVLFLMWRAQSASLSTLLADGQQRVVSLAGLLLFVSGLAVALLLLWRSR